MIYNFLLFLYPEIIELKRVVVFLKTEDDLLFFEIEDDHTCIDVEHGLFLMLLQDLNLSD